MKRLSVLMPFYNSSRFINAAVNSILNQTFSDFELIIINDGSTDNTDEIISSINDPRILYKKKEHTGLSDSINFGLSLVNTELVARMDADDLADAKRLQCQYDFMIKHPEYDITGTNIYVINSSDKILYSIKFPEYDAQIKKNLLINSVIPHPAILMKRSVFEKVGYYDTRNDVIADYDLWLRSIKTLKFYNIQKYLYSYRRHFDSLTGSLNTFVSERRKTYFLMENFLSLNKLQEIITDEEKSILNAKFLVRYSPYFEVQKILNNPYLLLIQKFYLIVLSAIPFYLKCLYFYFNPKLRIKYYMKSLKFNLCTKNNL